MKKSLIVLTVLALAGCASSYSEPELTSDHPANPAATESPGPPRSRILDLATAEPIAPIQPAHHEEMHHSDRAEGGHMHGARASTEPAQATVYVCPKHPEVKSDQPDQRCPKCGMKLKKKSDTEASNKMGGTQ
jgi:rubrerythrin